MKSQNKTVQDISSKQMEELINILKTRFEKNMKRHEGITWITIEKKLKDNPKKLWSLNEMEKTSGEPDVIGYDKKTNEYIFCDCSVESPKGRRNTCYDGEGQAAREKQGIYPHGNAVDMAANMGIDLLTEEQYKDLQKLGTFDTKTSSWIKTPASIRKLGGAIFADVRFGNVFIYHNTAPTFYNVRGFRGILRI